MLPPDVTDPPRVCVRVRQEMCHRLDLDSGHPVVDEMSLENYWKYLANRLTPSSGSRSALTLARVKRPDVALGLASSIARRELGFSSWPRRRRTTTLVFKMPVSTFWFD